MPVVGRAKGQEKATAGVAPMLRWDRLWPLWPQPRQGLFQGSPGGREGTATQTHVTLVQVSFCTFTFSGAS